MSGLCDPMDYTVHGILQSRMEWVAFPFFNPGIEPRSPTLQADSLPAEPQGKPKNTGVGRLSLLQQVFLTQESNWGLLHCIRILYQLSYQEALERDRNKSFLNLSYLTKAELCKRQLLQPHPHCQEVGMGGGDVCL